MSGARQTRWFLVGGAVFIVGALFLCLGLFDWLEIRGLDARFQQHARMIQGTVLTKTIVSSTSGGILRRQSSSRSYRVTYRFVTPEGKEFEGSAGMYSKTWDNLTVGGPIQIAYLPDEPLTNRVQGRTDLGSAAARLLMGGLLAAGGGALIVWDLRRSPLGSRKARQMRLPPVGVICLIALLLGLAIVAGQAIEPATPSPPGKSAEPVWTAGALLHSRPLSADVQIVFAQF